MIKVKKVEPPHKPKYFLFVMLIKRETYLERLIKKHPVPYQIPKFFKGIKIDPYKIDLKAFLRITPCPYKVQINLEKLKKIIANATNAN